MKELHDLYRDRPTGQTVRWTIKGSYLGQPATLQSSYGVPDNLRVEEEDTLLAAEAAWHQTYGESAEHDPPDIQIDGAPDDEACDEAERLTAELIEAKAEETANRVLELLGGGSNGSGPDDPLLSDDLPSA